MKTNKIIFVWSSIIDYRLLEISKIVNGFAYWREIYLATPNDLLTWNKAKYFLSDYRVLIIDYRKYRKFWMVFITSVSYIKNHSNDLLSWKQEKSFSYDYRLLEISEIMNDFDLSYIQRLQSAEVKVRNILSIWSLIIRNIGNFEWCC